MLTQRKLEQATNKIAKNSYNAINSKTVPESDLKFANNMRSYNVHPKKKQKKQQSNNSDQCDEKEMSSSIQSDIGSIKLI